MEKHSLFLAIFLSVLFSYSQDFERHLGGSNYDQMNSVKQTPDGGYICIGSTTSYDGDVTENHGDPYNAIYDDAWIVKLTSAGNIQWQKCLGGTLEDYAQSIEQTTDGGYIIAGTSNSNDGDVTLNHGNTDIWIVKLKNSGDIHWQRSLGGSLSEYAQSIQQTTDGGYIVGGYSSSNNDDLTVNHGGIDYWIVKLTNTGIIQWQRSIGGTGDEWTGKVQQTADGGYIIGGNSLSNDGDISENHGGHDIWSVKLTTTGSIQWKKCFGGTGNENLGSIQQTTDGGYIIAGDSASNDGDVTFNHGGSDFWIVKLNNAGTIQWQESFGGSAYDTVSSMVHTTDGGYAIVGSSGSNDGDVTVNNGSSDAWIIKLNNQGIIQWQKSLGSTVSDYGNEVRQTADGGYIIAGISIDNINEGNPDSWVTKVSNSGIIQYERTYGTYLGYDYLLSIELTADGGYIFAGISENDKNNYSIDGWIVKGGGTILSTDESTLENLFSIYPNPTDNEIHVNTMENMLGLPYTIYDQLGKSVITGKLNEHNSTIKTENLSKGVYFLSIGDKIKTNKKIIKE